MDIYLLLDRKIEDECWYSIIDVNTGEKMGFVFTDKNEVAYEVYEEYRNRGVATEVLKMVTNKINFPMLHITSFNFSSMHIAEKVGYVLVKSNQIFNTYVYFDKEEKNIVAR